MSSDKLFNGGYSCKLVSQPKELQTECSICLQLLRAPEMVSCCGNKFCQSCISHILNKNNRCPLCGQTNITTMPDRQLERTLYSLEVYCTQAQDGCKWAGQLRALEDHVKKVCLEAKVPCEYSNVGCREVLVRKKMAGHVESSLSHHMSLILNHTHKLAEQYNNIGNIMKSRNDDDAEHPPSRKEVVSKEMLNNTMAEMESRVVKNTRSMLRKRTLFFIVSIIVAGLAVILARDSHIWTKDNSGVGSDDSATVKQDMVNLEKRLESIYARLHYDTNIDGTDSDSRTQDEMKKLQDMTSDLKKTISDNERLYSEMLKLKADLEKIASTHNKLKEDKVNKEVGDMEKLKQRLASLEDFSSELANLKASKNEVEKLKLNLEVKMKELEGQLQAINKKLEQLPSTLQGLIAQELDMLLPPPHPDEPPPRKRRHHGGPHHHGGGPHGGHRHHGHHGGHGGCG